MKYSMLIFFIVLVFNNCFAQLNDVEFLTNKIKNDYAGYFDKTSDAKFDKYIHKVLKEETDTFRILSDIVSFFKDQHLQVYATDVLKDKIINSALCNENLKFIKQYFGNRQLKKDAIEGYWLNDSYTIIIAIVRKSKGIYNGYLIESDSAKVPFGFQLADIEQVKKGSYLINYIGVKGGGQAFFDSKIIGDSTIAMGNFTRWKKISILSLATLKKNKPKEAPVNGFSLNKDSYVLTLPSFSVSNIEVIDSIVKRDYQKICSSKNLIIDIRNNPGGRVKCYEPLLPFVYTNPIIEVSGYLRCSKGLIEHRKEMLAKYLLSPSIDSAVLSEIEKEVKTAEDNLGTFFFIAGDTVRLDSLKAYPQNVAVITNYVCASASEMMLLDFKQSKKVKIFGEHTAGVVDYLDVYRVELPSKKYWLGLATGKRFIPEGQTKLDGIGIQPDVIINDSNKDWVDFVRRYYEKH